MRDRQRVLLLSDALTELGADPGLLRDIDQADDATSPESLGASLAASVVASQVPRDTLADLAGTIARRLAPDDEPPADAAPAFAWLVLRATVDRLYGSAVANLGRLPFISDRLIELMAQEARAQLGERADPDPPARVTAPGGRALSALAVSRKLKDAISTGLGIPVAPARRALYAYDPPGSHVRTHVDSREYELIFHMILEHEPPADGTVGSALVVHLPQESAPRHLSLRPGEGVALSGRGTLHSWQRLRPGERRTMVEIGWIRA